MLIFLGEPPFAKSRLRNPGVQYLHLTLVEREREGTTDIKRQMSDKREKAKERGIERKVRDKKKNEGVKARERSRRSEREK